MAYKAMRPFTIGTRQYAKGETVNVSGVDPSRVASMLRLRFIHETGTDAPVSVEPARNLKSLRIGELRELAAERGIDPAGLSKAALLRALE